MAFVPEGQHDSARHEVPGSEVPGIMRKIARPSGTIERISFRLDASSKNGSGMSIRPIRRAVACSGQARCGLLMPGLSFDDKYPWD